MPSPLLAGRSGKILAQFPSFMRALTPSKSLAAVAGALGADQDEAERQAMRIQRAHRLPVADEARDLLALAALCDLHPADFFILDSLHAKGFFEARLPALPTGAPPRTGLEQAQQAYDQFVGRLRASIRRAIDVTLDGCGTIWSLLEGTAILVNATMMERPVQHLDDGMPRGGFVHRMAVSYDGWPPPPAGTPDPTGWIYLVENPLEDRSPGDTAIHQRARFRVNRGGFFDGQVTLQITGIDDRTVRPMLINETDHEGFFFAGVVGPGQKLVFTTEGKVLLDGTDVTAQAAFFTGSLDATGGPRDSRLAPAEQVTTPAPAASPDDVVDVVTPPGALDRAFPRPTVSPAASLPPLDLRLRESTWRFSVEEGAYDLSAYDQAVYAFPDDEGARLSLPPSGSVQLSWKENKPFAASVLLPAELKSLETAGLVVGDLPSLVRAGLERYRAAGVRLDVAYFDQSWLLAHSVLTSVDNTPPGMAAVPT